MALISDEMMMQLLTTSKNYTLIILKGGPNYNMPGVEKIIREHGRRNISLRADGILSIVCPVTDGGHVKGIGIFEGDMDTVRKIMDEDPGVMQDVFVYDIHPCRSFPGDRLPG